MPSLWAMEDWGVNMFLFDVQSELVTGQRCTVNTCPKCASQSVSHASVINYLSFTFLPIAPLKITSNLRCNKCANLFQSSTNESGEKAAITLAKMFKTTIGLPILFCLMLAFSLYQEYHQNWLSKARLTPKVNDVLFMDNYLRTHDKSDKPFPYRLAKVVGINLERRTVSLALSTVAYEELVSAQKDYAVRNYIFDSFYMNGSIEIPFHQLSDQNLVITIRRPFGEHPLQITQNSVSYFDKYQDFSRFINNELFNIKQLWGQVVAMLQSNLGTLLKTMFL